MRRVRIGRRLRVRHAYGDTGAVSAVVERSGALRLGAEWDDATTLELAVPDAEVREVCRALSDATGGRAEVEVEEGPLLVPLRG